MSEPLSRVPLNARQEHFGVVASRQLLVDTIRQLAPFHESLVVVGAHATYMWANRVLPDLDMQETRDADLSINPAFVASTPLLLESMAAIGVEPVERDRPGIYGYVSENSKPFKERTTIDLIVPEAYAGAGRRSARIPGQKNATTRAVGLELCVWDRELMSIPTLSAPVESVDAYVARPAALLVAKAHKIHDRLGQSEQRPARLRPKDSGDVALLMLASEPEQVAETIAENSMIHPEIHDILADAASYLAQMYLDPTTITRRHMTESLEAWYSPDTINDAVSSWITTFMSLTTPTSHETRIGAALNMARRTLDALPDLTFGTDHHEASPSEDHGYGHHGRSL